MMWCYVSYQVYFQVPTFMVSLPSAVDMPLLMVMPGPASGLGDHSRDQAVQGIELSSVFRDKDLCCCD